MIRLIRFGLRLTVLLALAGLVYLGVTFVQVWQASRTDGASTAEAIVVLGAAQYNGRPSPVFQARLDHAADLYQRGVAPLVVVTGGRVVGDDLTEAAVAGGYLASRGVPADAVRRESYGASSYESMAAAARILRAEGADDVVLVSSPYHALRTEHIAEEVGLTGHASPATASPEQGREELEHLGRETVAVGLGRIIGHRRLMNLNPAG